MKPFAFAKQRLADVLTPAERFDLARVMLTDLLGTLRACPSVTNILIISQEEGAAPLAKRYGAEWLPEVARGLSRAVTQAAQYLAARGVERMLMLPGDVPLATAAEIEQLTRVHGPTRKMTIVSDREGFGTNALVVSPPDLMGFHFGRESFQAHCAAAREAGADVEVLTLPGIAFDIDTPADLTDLMTYDTEAETLAYLCDRGVAARLAPRAHVHSAW